MSETSRLRDTDGADSSLNHAELYRAAVEEYRFQVSFNWSRTQYLLAFDVVILGAAVGLGSRSNILAVLVFLLGALAAVMSYVAGHTQHEYYRAARARVRRLEQAFGLAGDQTLDTTATMGGRRHPTLSVTRVSYLLFWAMAIADLVGVALVLSTSA